MSPLRCYDVLKAIDKLEGRKGFVRSNVRRPSPKLSDIWNQLLFDRHGENLNPNSLKVTTYRILKRAVTDGYVWKMAKSYTLTPKGQLLIRLEVGNTVKAKMHDTVFLSSTVFTSGPLVHEHDAIDDVKLDRVVRKIEEVLREEEVPEDTNFLIKVGKPK